MAEKYLEEVSEERFVGVIAEGAPPGGSRGAPFRDAWRAFKRSKMAVVGLVIILGLIFIAIFAPFISPHDPYAIPTSDEMLKLSQEFDPPKLPPHPPRLKDNHWFGTDDSGRDVFSRVIYGSRVSILVGVGVEAVVVVIGFLIGVIAGYYGGRLDNLFMRITDIFMAFPSLVLAIAITAAIQEGLKLTPFITLKPGLSVVFMILVIVGWPTTSRVVRGQVLSLKETEFIQAVKALGARDSKIIFRHILPNCVAPVMVTATIGIAGNILSEAGLSFLGFGVKAPTISWGSMLEQGRNYLITGDWWVCVFPGLAITITLLGFNLLGDGLRDILDPRLRNA
ncbi:MAG: ABC transporter permease [bacterium]